LHAGTLLGLDRYHAATPSGLGGQITS